MHEEEAKEFCVAGSGAELEAAEQAKKYAGILTVEEGGVLNGKAERWNSFMNRASDYSP